MSFDKERRIEDEPGWREARIRTLESENAALRQERDEARLRAMNDEGTINLAAEFMKLQSGLGEALKEAERLRGERDEANRQRDLAIAHDRQSYPTAEAYEKACAALNRKTERLAQAEEALRRLMVNPHGCRFCDYGKLRNPEKGHDKDCEYVIGGGVLHPPGGHAGFIDEAAALASTPPPSPSTTEHADMAIYDKLRDYEPLPAGPQEDEKRCKVVVWRQKMSGGFHEPCNNPEPCPVPGHSKGER